MLTILIGPNGCGKTNFLKNLKEMYKNGWQLGDLYRVGDPLIGGWPW